MARNRAAIGTTSSWTHSVAVGNCSTAWERGWNCLLTTLKALEPEDCSKTVMIRGEPHTVPLALERSLGHTCYHIGQIVQVARIHAGEKWNTLTIPRGGSEQFNQASWGQSGKSHS